MDAVEFSVGLVCNARVATRDASHHACTAH